MHTIFRFSVSVLLVALTAEAAWGDAFEVWSRPPDGRTLAAEFVDVDGDARTDLVRVVARGFPPQEERIIHVYRQDESGALPEKPSFSLPLPEKTAAYDLADIRPEPGTELLLLRSDGLDILSLASPQAPRSDIAIGSGTTVGAAVDERGLERLRMVYTGAAGDDPFLAIPTFQDLVILSTKGEEKARLATNGRANFFIPQNSGLAFLESDLQIFFDAPHISVADVDGDGLSDVISSNRHQVRVFRGTPGGNFPDEADQITDLQIISDKDQVRGSGGVAIDVTDLDADGRGDLVATYLGGGFTDARMETRIYMNKGSGWNLSKPDRVFVSENTVGLDRPVDLDGDGRLELVRGTLSFSLLQFVETLLTREVDVEFDVYQLDAEGRFGDDPWIERDLAIPLSFDTFRPEGFLPVFGVDMNADGYGDLVRSGNGDRIEINYGGPRYRFRDVNASQEMDTKGLLRLGDWNGDRLTDAIVFDPQDPESTLRVVVNRGLETPDTKPPRRTLPRGRRP